MPQLARELGQFGIQLPGTPMLIEAGVALALLLGALAAGWLAGKRLGPRIAQLWTQRFGIHAEGLGERMCSLTRHGAGALLLAVVFNAGHWHHLAALELGLALAASVAVLTSGMLRGLSLPRGAAWAMAVIAFAAVLSHALGGLGEIETVLERVGVDVGKRRVSLLSVLTFAITVVALYAAVKLANRLIGQSIRQARALDPTQKLLFEKLAAIAVIVVAFFVGVDLLGLDLTSFAVFSGALGLAVGFGLQKTVGNLLAGIILLMDRSIKPGDVIVVGGKEVGWVNKIGVRAVSIVTRDGKEHLIPNELLMTQEVENWSYSDRNVRVRIPVGVAYTSDLQLAQELMLRAAAESPRVLASPKPNVWLTAFGDNAVEHEILAWISDPEGGVGNVKSDVLNRLWLLFREHGVEIPFAQMDVRVKEWPVARKNGEDGAAAR